MTEQLQKAIDCMNDAWRRDQLAVRALLINVTACNAELADHPTLIARSYDEGFTIGVLGVINGLFDAMGVGGRIAAMWSNEADEWGARKFIGFCDYDDPTKQK